MHKRDGRPGIVPSTRLRRCKIPQRPLEAIAGHIVCTAEVISHTKLSPRDVRPVADCAFGAGDGTRKSLTIEIWRKRVDRS